ncbi:hypothetical protein L2X99_08970 [Microbacterium sp. KUDC0406]|uniref:hypothetical protein n=1 Tax=Microbacterium sp. KUDC0406 TaxID=2909588 RepID=UPI001F2924D9|nr:hypothetical protein [Microbacterium sp. KUDC0406]UJP11589.1 hypothetical protein L2X99_08970 [Microbacterium sp. KUDC0406]
MIDERVGIALPGLSSCASVALGSRYRFSAQDSTHRVLCVHSTTDPCSRGEGSANMGIMSTAKLSSIIASLGLAALALAGCTAATAPQAAGTPNSSATAVAQPVTETAPSASPEAERCSGMSQVYGDGGGLYLERGGTLKDLGAREFARGKVTLDAEGVPATYTVEAGDVMAVVAERLCAYPTLDSMNHRRDIHPGQVLWLTPDPNLPWIPYYNPDDAPAGFKQIPYQQAIEAAGRAVDAGDVATVRKIWNETLRPMFTNQETITAVQKVVDSGDPDGLRQLFS